MSSPPPNPVSGVAAVVCYRTEASSVSRSSPVATRLSTGRAGEVGQAVVAVGDPPTDAVGRRRVMAAAVSARIRRC
jgi:hypothetical protein